MSNTPPRLAVDANGFVWRVYDDGAWSMAPVNPDNSPVPEPVTFYEPATEDRMTRTVTTKTLEYDEKDRVIREFVIVEETTAEAS